MKTITFTEEELRVLRIYLGGNPCENGCKVNPKPKCDCYDLKDGEFVCPFMNLVVKLEGKIGCEGSTYQKEIPIKD